MVVVVLLLLLLLLSAAALWCQTILGSSSVGLVAEAAKLLAVIHCGCMAWATHWDCTLKIATHVTFYCPQLYVDWNGKNVVARKYLVMMRCAGSRYSKPPIPSVAWP
jgi:hypothetical protein